MSTPLVLKKLNLPDMTRLAEEVAFMLSPGDCIALTGELGAGKTTFARALIRAASGERELEVPSPTFTLTQLYETPRFEIAHLDLYRIETPNEVEELGIEAALLRGIAVIEWPERGEDRMPTADFILSFTDDGDGDNDTRSVTMSSNTASAPRLARFTEIRDFLSVSASAGTDYHLSYLQGDASPRRYARLIDGNGKRSILMDSPKQGDGPPIQNGLPYSQIAHLAEDVRPFAAISTALNERGFSAPEIFAHDLNDGLLLIEDFGDAVFGSEVKRGRDQANLWQRATDTLIALRASPPIQMPLPDGTDYQLPKIDRHVLNIETQLLLDWYWPSVFGKPAHSDIELQFTRAWSPLFDAVLAAPFGWLLRDFHSPNLIALDNRKPPRDVGIIDFQDAMIGPHAYDLVSLLQDARVDVSADLETNLIERYLEQVSTTEAHFDADQFRFVYAALGAQRNTKILGIFARLAKRDGKRQYLTHLPRIWGYLARNLAHPGLTELAAWYDAHLPADIRRRGIAL
ncbi:MAG: tRNA (adenosine(37)-N6)-threonylcarbamoyltransferase complex ATPase subunit type 1 TsaE [Hyphomicrobium sp.]|nr:MAG: tRNA (adenosine(37)-N6)-threonylcarbamoyltransferase complex ATPase subunit type 1 TsaE [Hyphomicrobium sp.]PPD01297.1 MAG: tRNA (adenosine(37)-N6)-threonylcarbamoyltransferase complex ATPase subunit type 1 TsaE [Hyphomicrobium sp.]